MEKSLRYNEDKPKWSLVHYKSLEPMVRVLEMGAVKYSLDNWKIGLNRDEILESTMRHLTALMDGELLDKESGISHMAHIQCNAMFYNYHEANNSFVADSIPKHRHGVSIHDAYSLEPGEESKIICRPDSADNMTPNHVSSSTLAPTRENDGYAIYHPDWSERKKATFKFFNEFPEPWRSQAMKNYNESQNEVIPESQLDSIGLGFSWRDSPEGDIYWRDFSKTLSSESA